MQTLPFGISLVRDDPAVYVLGDNCARLLMWPITTSS
jgi:hypothetical protein